MQDLNNHYEALTYVVMTYGGRRPIWKSNDPVAKCWMDRAELVESLARDGKETQAAVAECNRYAGR